RCLWSFFFFSSRRRHTRFSRDWSSDVCSSDLLLDEGVVELKRQKVRVGKIAIVVRFFLGAHRTGLALARVEQTRLLVDRTAVFQDADLTAGLIFDRLADEADGVDVLDLAARAETFTRAAD